MIKEILVIYSDLSQEELIKIKEPLPHCAAAVIISIGLENVMLNLQEAEELITAIKTILENTEELK